MGAKKQVIDTKRHFTSNNEELEEKYYDLLRLQRRVNQVLDSQVTDCDQDLESAKDHLAREVEKLVRFESGPEIFKAIARAAWEAPDSESFAELANTVEAKVRLKRIMSRYGTPDAFTHSLSEEQEEISNKEKRAAKLEESISKLEKRLEMIDEYHLKNRSSLKISLDTQKRIEDYGFFSSDSYAGYAASVVKKYAKKYAVGESRANCFKDMARLAQERAELESLEPAIAFAKDQHFKNLAEYKEVREIQDKLGVKGSIHSARFNLGAFQQEFIERLGDKNFIACFARETASGVAGDVILAALSTNMRQNISDDLISYRDNVRGMTELFEGPIGILAKNSGRQRSIDGIEQDVRAQALVAGYLTEQAAASFKALRTFRPEHTEGPISLSRDLQMHMAVNGDVDPAYIQEVLGMGQLLTKYFNVNASRPQPDFKKVLGNPNAVERIDRRFAAYLKENAADKQVADAGFAAGQFNTNSVEVFLKGRYFKASAQPEEVISALQEEADKVDKVRKTREKHGIDPNGPDVPDVT